MPSPYATYPNGGYPFTFGYCQESDVQARISSGSWNEAAVDASPNVSQTQVFIQQSTGMIDIALAARGYTVPLAPIPGQTISPVAYVLLQNICANLSAGFIERSRHGAMDKAEDSDASFYFKLADDLLLRIEMGHDNLSIFGVAGAFEPQVDHAKGLAWGGVVDMRTGMSGPTFTKGMDFG